jgi:AcrR family transcriptional regulator
LSRQYKATAELSDPTTSGENGGITDRSPGRPRDRDVDRKIVDAAVELYAERGWGSFNFDAVAKRAGIGKPAIYRRYRTREELLTEAVAATMTSHTEIDTGSLRSDLKSFILVMFHFRMGVAGTAVLRIMADQFYNPEIAAAYRERIVKPMVREARKIVERAKKKKQLSENIDANLLLEAISGAVSVRVWDTRLDSRDKLYSIIDRYSEDLLDVVLRGSEI